VAGAGAAPVGRAVPEAAGPVDLDRADSAALEALPGIGPALAGRIVAERTARGPFGTVRALDARVRGVGPALAARLAPLIAQPP
jgi:competence protein ComEA